MTTNIQTKLSELQERNTQKAFLLEKDGVPLQDIAELLTTDNFKAVALAVIREIKKDLEARMQNEDYEYCYVCAETMYHLTTLEATLKDLTPTPQDQNGHKINSDGSLCYDAKCRHCVRKDVIRE